MSRAKNPKYESMSLEELKANMEKSRQELEAAIHHKNILEQRKKLVERRERSHRLIVKGAEFEKVFPLSRRSGTGRRPGHDESTAEQQLQQEYCAAGSYSRLTQRSTADCRSSKKDREGR